MAHVEDVEEPPEDMACLEVMEELEAAEELTKRNVDMAEARSATATM